ncbi:MAG: SLC45 family MFS transporter [Synechococcales cyanobacterium RU_4_20]|nr:SLC45 family MFS transporter [Synechococcales cyanobacterium RU_4_20]
MVPFPIPAARPQRVLWPPVIALACVQGAIALLWIVYNLYLGQLLTLAGLSTSLASTLLLIENGIAAVAEPFAGSLCDRLQAGLGSQWPLILFGTVLSALCFLLIPGFALGNQSLAQIGLPACIILWALCMTLFRSPALALLGRYATPSQLPQAAVLLTLMGGLTGAIKPLSGDWIMGWGPQVAFGVGSLTLLLAVGVFWKVQPRLASLAAIAPVAATPAAAPRPTRHRVPHWRPNWPAFLARALG